MGVYYFPSEFIFWTENKKHTELKDELVEKINQDAQIREENTRGVQNAITNFTGNADSDFLNDNILRENIEFISLKEIKLMGSIMLLHSLAQDNVISKTVGG